MAGGNGPGGRGGGGQANLALMDLLAQYAADVNAKICGTLSYPFHIGYGTQNDGVNSKEGTSALHEAARSGRQDLVKHLLDLGANPSSLMGMDRSRLMSSGRPVTERRRLLRAAEAEAAQ